MISNIFTLLASVLSLYSMVIFIRILFSWFSLRNNSNGAAQNRVIQFLYSITDPYLNWFRRFSFLRVGMMDFSPMLGILIIYFFSSLFSQIGATGTLSIVFIIKLIIITAWSLISSIATFAIIALIIRILFIQFNRYSQFFQVMDGYIESTSRKFARIFTKKFLSYKMNLIILTMGIFVARLAAGYLLTFLLSLF